MKMEQLSEAIVKEVQRIINSSLADHSLWIFLGQGLSIICQALYFILLGRMLGSTEYGIYVGAVALVLVAGRYSSLGSAEVFVRYVSPNREEFKRYWGNILLTTIGLGIVLAVLITWLGPYIAHSYSRSILICIATGECLCAQVTAACSRIFIAFQKAKMTALVSLLTNFLRATLAAGMLFTMHKATVQQWVIAAMLISLTGAVVTTSAVILLYGKPSFSLGLLRNRTCEGIVFALSSSTAGLYNDVDKAMLGHYGMNKADGIYTMAYRVVDVCTTPLYAIHTAAFPRFYVKGVAGVQKTAEYGKAILQRTAPLSLFLTVGMFLAAPLIPHLVGKGFAESVNALRWLCLLPFFRSVHVSTGDALTGSGHQRARLTTQTIAAVFNFGINVFLIPRYSWYGAAWSSLCTDGGLAILNWSVLIAYQRRQRSGY